MSACHVKKLVLFLLIELLLYLMFLYIDIFTVGFEQLSSYLKFLAIIVCFIFTLLLDTSIKLYRNLFRFSFFFTMVSDVFLLLIDKNTLGVSTFLIVQSIYRYYLWKVSKEKDIDVLPLRYLYFPNVIISCFMLVVFKMCLQYNDSLLTITIFYFVSIVINVISSVKVASRSKEPSNIIFALGMILFLLCDISVGVFNMGDFIQISHPVFPIIYNIASVSMWFFYLPSQVMISLSLLLYQHVKCFAFKRR